MIYVQVNAGQKSVLQGRISTAKQNEIIKVNAVTLDFICIRFHPDGMGALKNGPQSIDRIRGGWSINLHTMPPSIGMGNIALYVNNRSDSPQGCSLLKQLGSACSWNESIKGTKQGL